MYLAHSNFSDFCIVSNMMVFFLIYYSLLVMGRRSDLEIKIIIKNIV